MCAWMRAARQVTCALPEVGGEEACCAAPETRGCEGLSCVLLTEHLPRVYRRTVAVMCGGVRSPHQDCCRAVVGLAWGAFLRAPCLQAARHRSPLAGVSPSPTLSLFSHHSWPTHLYTSPHLISAISRICALCFLACFFKNKIYHFPTYTVYLLVTFVVCHPSHQNVSSMSRDVGLFCSLLYSQHPQRCHTYNIIKNNESFSGILYKDCQC